MITSGLFTSNDNTWTTPKDFFDKLNLEFNFTMDAAALFNSTLVPTNWLGPDHPQPLRRDALIVDWDKLTDGFVWMNPPYGREISGFMNKANEENKKGVKVVCLVPSRTDTNWWHDYVIHHEVRFIKGRLKFGNKGPAPFPSALVIMQ